MAGRVDHFLTDLERQLILDSLSKKERETASMTATAGSVVTDKSLSTTTLTTTKKKTTTSSSSPIVKTGQTKTTVSTVSKTSTNKSENDGGGNNLPTSTMPGKRGRKRKKDSSNSPAAKTSVPTTSEAAIVKAKLTDSGCFVCGKDSDHAKMLLCEGCNGEYHTYCLNPPLQSIPDSDWFCDGCRPDEGDGLDRLVESLPPEFTSRFGEICWAQGGMGYGWWPSMIHDPRLTAGSARYESRKHLGRRHLVYFFQCDELPFAILPALKIMDWYEGIAEDLHLGRAAKAFSRVRYALFQQALQSALIEMDKPPSQRLNSSSSGNMVSQSRKSSTPEATADKKSSKKNRKGDSSEVQQTKKDPKTRMASTSNAQEEMVFERIPRQIAQRQTGLDELLVASISSLPLELEKQKINAESQIEKSNSDIQARDDEMSADAYECVPKGSTDNQEQFAKEATSTGDDDDDDNDIEGTGLWCKIVEKKHFKADDPLFVDVGFVILPNASSTFMDVRATIMNELVPDSLPPQTPWRFYIPTLGPVTSKQETRLGPAKAFLKRVKGKHAGDGIPANPLVVAIIRTSTR